LKFLFLKAGAIFALSLLLIVVGCSGGGGGGASQHAGADRQELVGRVEAILNILASGKASELADFRQSSDSGLYGAQANFFPFLINNPLDGNSFTFFIEPDGIVFLSATQALVPVWIWFADGEKINLEFGMIREDSVWFIDSISSNTLDYLVSANSTGMVPSTALLPLAKGNRWQFAELSLLSDPGSLRGETFKPGVLELSASRADFRTISIAGDPLTGSDGRETFSLNVACSGAKLADGRVELPFDPSTIEFGRFSDGLSAVDQGFFKSPGTDIAGPSLWEILDPSNNGSVQMFDAAGLFFISNDSSFNGGRAWRLTDMMIQTGTGATQSITLTPQGNLSMSGDTAILIMDPLPVNFPWLQGKARRIDISFTWSGTGKTTWCSLFFLPGIGMVGWAEYDFATRKPSSLACLWDADVLNRKFSAAGKLLPEELEEPEEPEEPAELQIVQPPAPVLTLATAFSTTLEASGGVSPYTWQLDGAPNWLSVSAADGILSGTPDQSGPFTFTLTLTDSSQQTQSLELEWSVADSEPPPPSPLTVTLETATGQNDPADSQPVNFTVVFSRPVTGFSSEDVSLSGTALPSACTVTETAPNDGTTYNLAVFSLSQSGTVIPSIPANVAHDAEGIANQASTSVDGVVTFALPTDLSPVLTMINPSRGVFGTRVTLTGQYLGTGGTLMLGSVEVTEVTEWTDTTITFVVPANIAPGTLNVTVTPTGADTSATLQFEIVIWMNVSLGGVTANLKGLTFDGDTGWAVGGETILKSTDAGRTWSLVDGAIGEAMGVDLRAVSAGAGKVMMVGYSQQMGGGYCLTDRSGEWDEMFMAMSKGLWAIAATDLNASVVLGGEHAFASPAAEGQIIYSSTDVDEDGYGDWTDVVPDSAPPNPSAVPFIVRGLAKSDGINYWAAGLFSQESNFSWGLARSMNMGESWVIYQNYDTPPPSVDYFGIHFVDASNGWAVGADGTVIHTVDGGDNWLQQTTPAAVSAITLRAVSFADTMHGYAVGDGGTILATTDGGSTWVSQTSGVNQDLFAVSFNAVRQGMIAGSQGVILITNSLAQNPTN